MVRNGESAGIEGDVSPRNHERDRFDELRASVAAAARLCAPAFALGSAALAALAIRRRGTERDHHTSQSERAWESAGTKILIVGAGFGGTATALALDRQLRHDEDAAILVVDRGNAQLFVPLLWTVAEGRANAENVVVPLRSYQRGRSFHVLHADVRHIDLDRRVVVTSAGERAYDKLVIALGSVTAIPRENSRRTRACVGIPLAGRRHAASQPHHRGARGRASGNG
jgi:hypothetical protein